MYTKAVILFTLTTFTNFSFYASFNIVNMGNMGNMGQAQRSAARSLLHGGQSPSQLRVNGQRVNAHLAALAEFGKNPQGGVSRIAYSDADLKGREYAMKSMREARLDVTIDSAGNIVGRRKGSDPALKPLVIGSHIDSVPEGGNYDGQV